MAARQLITGALPFRDIPNEARVILAIDDPERLPDITQHASFTHLHALQEIMQLCWLPDPELRAKVEDCLAAARSEASPQCSVTRRLTKFLLIPA